MNKNEKMRLYPIGRDTFKYCEGDRCLLVQLELLSGKVTRLLYPSTIKEWLPPYENEPISEQQREEITRRIWKYLNEAGERTEIFGMDPNSQRTRTL